MGRSSPCVGQLSMPTYIQPRSVIMSLGASAGLCSTRHRHAGHHRTLVAEREHARVLHVVALQGGHAVLCLEVGCDVRERGMTHACGRRVVEQPLIVSRLQASGCEPGRQVAQAVLDRIPELVHDVAVNARRRGGEAAHSWPVGELFRLREPGVHHAGRLPAHRDSRLAKLPGLARAGRSSPIRAAGW